MDQRDSCMETSHMGKNKHGIKCKKQKRQRKHACYNLIYFENFKYDLPKSRTKIIIFSRFIIKLL